MKLPQLRKLRRGFTLIELLTVIAIIGILAAAATKVIPMAKMAAKKMTASSNARDISIAYHQYAFGEATTHSFTSAVLGNYGGGASVTGWAVALAAKTGVNDGKAWFIDYDPQLATVDALPQVVANLANPNKPVVDPAFQSTSPKSWAVVMGATKSENNANFYPIVWTRGLTADGWSLTSPWQGRGGHIAYLDGHVEWYDSTMRDDGKGIFIHATTQQPSRNIRDALGTGPQILQDAQ